jgi:phage terminase large subunit-like protein
MAGRGFGKTRTGAEWVREQVMAGRMRRIALVGPTAADVRDVMVEGESGLLAVCDRYNFRPVYEPSKRRLLFPNGAIATTYSADEPNRLRGPQHDGAWADEVGAWRYPDAFDQLQFGLRLGVHPRQVITTTPKPVQIVRQLVKQAAEVKTEIRISRGSTIENASNLAPSFLTAIEARYAGTRLGRQELDGELLEDVEGALWTLSLIDEYRVKAMPVGVDPSRIVVAVDPPITATGAECGIAVAAKGSDQHGYVLDDRSRQGTPNEWGTAAIAAFDEWRADAVVIETNQGGDMVENTLRTIRPNLPIKRVHASRGKATRAEPISALYEQGRIHHVGFFPSLEDQMCTWVQGEPSPDRMDALVWALTDLAIDPNYAWSDYDADNFATFLLEAGVG